MKMVILKNQVWLHGIKEHTDSKMLVAFLLNVIMVKEIRNLKTEKPTE